MVVAYLYSQHDKGWAYINANKKLGHSMNIEHTRELSTLAYRSILLRALILSLYSN